ncbi:MAG: ECF transporter S component [Planctomycetota bacterium]
MIRALDSRAVVRMATGAALYGVLSWLTNLLHLPSASLISARPAIVVPIFFGYAFGPGVGFFTGLVGNGIGDALTGWGFYPQWDLGNGLVGAVAGLPRFLPGSARAPDVLAPLAIGALLLAAWAMSRADTPLEAGFVPADWVPAEHYGWPLLLAGLMAAAWVVARRQGSSAGGVLWGLIGIFAGIGSAALIDVPYNGMTIEAALFGEFLPATVANAVSAIVLLPPLSRAYERARERAGR